jgi:hypothetical protein
MKLLNNEVLQVGDIVLTTGIGGLSASIRWKTSSDISHAMLVVQPGSLVDSTSEGVQARNPQRMPIEDGCTVHVLRLLTPPTQVQLDRIIHYARSQIGAKYAYKEAYLSVIGPVRPGSKRQFCSRLVSRAYAEAGIHLAVSVDFCSPGDLQRSSLLREVPNVTRPISDEELLVIRQIPDTTQVMMEATNALLEDVRKITPGIETLNDVNAFLYQNRGFDAVVNKIIQESGYLDVWRFERDKNPWQYDLQLMHSANLSEEAKEHYCSVLVEEAEDSLQRYEVCRAQYTQWVEETALETFRTYKDLYETLVQLHLTRVRVATEWLQANAPERLSAAPPRPVLEPHSKEWFAALEKINAAQAAMTHAAIATVGRIDVCSICGDEPSKAYRLVGRNIPVGAVHSLRLCNDCWGIRRSMYAESPGLVS